MRACSRRDPHTCPSHAPQPTCAHCGNPDVLRPIQMTAVCRPCVAALGRIAGDPMTAAPAVWQRLEDASLDVLRLAAGGYWSWTATWPAAGDLRTLAGRTA